MTTNEFIHSKLVGHENVSAILLREEQRQDNTIELIASENFQSDAVRAAEMSVFMSKYGEGYPQKDTGASGRYYGGCEYADALELYCIKKWKEVFHTDYHVNVQPHSGSQANYAAFAACLDRGDTILSLSLNDGGHLTHGSRVNFSGKNYKFVHYGLDENGYLSLTDLYNKMLQYKPRMVLVGASAYSRKIPFYEIGQLIDAATDKIKQEDRKYTRPFYMVDMAHIAGLIAAGLHETPFGVADIITTTTHKTLRGPRGGLIFCKTENRLPTMIDKAVFPGSQGGPLLHVIAAKAVCAEEACTLEFKKYMRQVIKNSAAFARAFSNLGYDVLTGGTDNHMFIVDFSKTHPNLTGKMIQDALENPSDGLKPIAVNKNCVPNDKRPPNETSGIRFGVAAMTTKGYDQLSFILLAKRIRSLINSLQENVDKI